MELTLQDMYYPNLEKFYFYTVIANFTVSTILLPFMIYIVITKSTKPMGEYKLLILNQILWSYAFILVLTIWLPIPVLPFTIAYPIGIAKLFPETSFYKCFFAFVFCAIGTGHSIFVSFLYRIVKLKSNSTVAKFYSIKWLIFPARAITLTSSIAVFMIPMILEDTTLEALMTAVLNDTKLMEFYFNNPKFNGIGGYHMSVGNGWVKIFLIEISCLCILLFVAVILIHTFFVYQMKKFRLYVSASTYRLHQMLYRALTIQLGLVTGSLILPLTIYFMLFYFQIAVGSLYAIIFISFTSFVANCNYIVICYYIKPYRVYIFKKITKVLDCLGCEKAAVASFSLSKSTQHAGYNVNTIY